MKRSLIIGVMILSTIFSACRTNAPAEENDFQPLMTDSGVTVLSDRTTDEGVRELSVKPSSVCSSQIDIEVKDGIILMVKFTNGCDGNTKGVSSLIQGMSVEEAVKRLKGIDCGGKGTSCPDQLAKALELML